MTTQVLRLAGALPLGDEILQGWAEIPTTIASDASGGRLLMDPTVRPLRPLGSARLLGPAATAWCEAGDIGAAIHVIEHAKAGEVVVIDRGRKRPTVIRRHDQWAGVMGTAAASASPVLNLLILGVITLHHPPMSARRAHKPHEHHPTARPRLG